MGPTRCGSRLEDIDQRWATSVEDGDAAKRAVRMDPTARKPPSAPPDAEPEC